MHFMSPVIFRVSLVEKIYLKSLLSSCFLLGFGIVFLFLTLCGSDVRATDFYFYRILCYRSLSLKYTILLKISLSREDITDFSTKDHAHLTLPDTVF